MGIVCLFFVGDGMGIDLIDLWVSIEQVLTPEEFNIFKLRHKYNHTQEQMGEILGCSRWAVNRILSSIYAKLRQLL